MRIAATISRYLLGLMFLVFGLNGFFHFLPQPPPSSALAGQFFGVMMGSHYMVPVFLVQVIGGVLLLANRFVPLALTLLGPVLVNILTFHITMDPGGVGPGILATVLWAIVFMSVRTAFDGIFQARPIPAVGSSTELRSPSASAARA